MVNLIPRVEDLGNTGSGEDSEDSEDSEEETNVEPPAFNKAQNTKRKVIE